MIFLNQSTFQIAKGVLMALPPKKKQLQTFQNAKLALQGRMYLQKTSRYAYHVRWDMQMQHGMP